MSSALAAFAKAQIQQAPPADVIEDEEDEAYASDHDHDVPSSETVVVPTSSPSTLQGFAQSQQDQKTHDKTMTLVDVAKTHQLTQPTNNKPTLVDVARRHDQTTTSNQLHMIAMDVQNEESDAIQRRADEIQRQLLTTSQQVQAEQRASRKQQVQAALHEATQEEPAYNAQDDPFEADDDAAVVRAADRVVEETTAKPKPRKIGGGSLSLDRHVLKQRTHHPGAASKSTAKAKTMKDALSTFQFDQLSLMQQRVFLAMLVEDKHGSIKKTCNQHAIEALAKDRATQLREKQRLLKIKPPKYAKLEDARHCRFVPKIKATGGASRGRDDDEDDEDGGGGNQRREDFIRRMEATERVRTEQLRRTRAERDYLAQIDKKECPQCGNPQSYAELSQKRKKCPNCGVPYKSRLAWGEIADEFLSRMASHLEARLGASSADNQREESPLSSKPTTRWADVRDDFLGRVQLDLRQRELTKELILHELEAQCTFAPQITDRARRLRLTGDFDERLRRDVETRRLRQEQYRVLSAAIAQVETATGKTQKRPPKPLSRSFDERLRKDLQQRRERLAANANAKPGRSRGLY